MKNRKNSLIALGLLLLTGSAAAADSGLPDLAGDMAARRVQDVMIRSLDEGKPQTLTAAAAQLPPAAAVDYSTFLEQSLRERLPNRPVVTIYRYKAANAASHSSAWMATLKGDGQGIHGEMMKVLLRRTNSDLQNYFKNWD